MSDFLGAGWFEQRSGLYYSNDRSREVRWGNIFNDDSRYYFFNSIDPDSGITKTSYVIKWVAKRKIKKKYKSITNVLACGYWGSNPNPVNMFYYGLPSVYKKKAKVSECGKPFLGLLLNDGIGFYILRVTREGDFAGQTYHDDLNSTNEQIKFELGKLDGVWKKIPEIIPDMNEVTEQHLLVPLLIREFRKLHEKNG
jgi:hypothetical protein